VLAYSIRQKASYTELMDSEVVVIVLHSVTKDTIALEVDTAGPFLLQGRVVEVRMDIDMLVAEKMG